MKSIHVVAGIIYNQQRDQILIARRPDHLHMGGFWEFPGGKIDDGELPQEALARELQEELSIYFSSAECYQQVNHTYPDKKVLIEFWSVFDISGQAKGNEGQQIAWVPVQNLANYAFPPANQPVVEALLASL
jgi:8-oxo-dGTP diphosphatase